MDFYDLLTTSEKARKLLPELGFQKSVKSVEIKPKELDSAYQPDAIVFCSGKTEKENKKIARAPVDVLLDPVVHYRRTIDTALMQIAKDNEVAIGISLQNVLGTKKFRKAGLLKQYRLLVKLCQKVGTRIVLTSGAGNEFQVRSPEQLIAFGKTLGLTRDQAKWSLSKIPKALIERKELGGLK